MELMIFFAVVGVIAACMGIYGLIEIRKQDAKKQFRDRKRGRMKLHPAFFCGKRNKNP